MAAPKFKPVPKPIFLLVAVVVVNVELVFETVFWPELGFEEIW
jgi:hypothetical protein